MKKLRFVVQKHDATTLHYDFRLETEEGILKSWAVPKGVSIDPQVRRLAILTDDHSLDYLLFEGVIPAGNYGSGTVIVWDTGKYVLESPTQNVTELFRNGKLTFTLFGQKLNGKFSIIKIKRGENQWLIIKMKDKFASEEDLTLSRPESVLTNIDK